MRVLVTGATGFIGRELVRALVERGDDVVALTRSPEQAKAALPELSAAYPWRAVSEPAPASAFEGVDAVVNLVGERTAGRWTSDKRRAILETRETATLNLVAGMRGASVGVLVSGSALGYYGERGDEELTEDSSRGGGFLAEVCAKWEEAANTADARVVTLRTGLVIGRGGGFLDSLTPMAKLGLSGPLGSGLQWWPWVHRDDAVSLALHALDRPDMQGPLNVSAPGLVRQREFARALGRALGRPAFLPAPGPALRLALGGFAAEVLSSRRMLPAKALAAGFPFRYPDLEGALREAL